MIRPRVAIALLVVAAGLVLGGATPTAAQGRSASRAEAADLARRAVSDDDALARLRTITRVDGQEVDLVAATADLGDHRTERLNALAEALEGPDGSAIGTTDPQGLARQVLEADKYHDKRLPKPFRGPLRWLADRLRPITDAFGSLVDALDAIPGGPFLALGAVAAAIVALIWWLVGRRSGAAVTTARAGWLVDPTADPGALEAEADAAEAAGDHALAVRRRYEAGLLRLADAHRIDLRPDTTASGVAAALGDATLGGLTATFESVVYGGAPAAASDAAAARSGWRTVLGR